MDSTGNKPNGSKTLRKRKTIQQKLVCDALKELTGHPTAQDVHQKIQETYRGISVATVYSNLKQLVQNGQLRVLSFAGRADRYEMNLTQHYHIRCQQCGEVCDLPATGLHEIHAHIADASGYLVTGHEILFYGLCPTCQEAQ